MDRDTKSLDSSGSAAGAAFGGRSWACRVCVCVSGSKSNDNFTSRAALHLSATTGLRVGGSKEQVGMCDLGSHCLHLYGNYPRRDSEAQSYRHQVKRH